jgi:hypothetical protein
VRARELLRRLKRRDARNRRPSPQTTNRRKHCRCRIKTESEREKLDKARAALEKPGTDYAPLSEVHPATSTGRRSALARFIVDRNNPLAARVAVNHVWLRHFDRAIVPTVFDFGLNGRAPSHPELLDWLAVEFMESGWNMKHLHRLIVLSSTYQLESASPENSPNAAIDPDNIYLWRMNSRRAEAEVVRDCVLSVSGQLDLTPGVRRSIRSRVSRHFAAASITATPPKNS